MDLSIILTVYNKEPYLHRCFGSLLEQKDVKDGDYEVLVINDGSTDGSLSICEEYAKKDNRVRIITQTNQGLSMARNNGIEPAKGKYVWFVDSDDTIASDAVCSICSAMATNPDVIPIYAVSEKTRIEHNKIPETIATGKEVLLHRWEHCGVFWVMKKVFLISNGLSFYPGIYHEDAEFTPRMLYLAKSVKVVPKLLYTVYNNDAASITSVPRPKRAYDMLFVVESLMNFFTSNGEQNSSITKSMNHNNSGILNTAFFVISCNEKVEWKKFNEELFNKRSILRTMTASGSFKYFLEGCLLRMARKRYVEMFRLIRKII